MNTGILFTADLHLTLNPLDEYRWSTFSWLAKRARVLGAGAVCILGDLTDSKDNHNSLLVNRLVTELRRLAEVCEVHILAGNHDYLDPACPFFKFLGATRAKHPITFYTEPTAAFVAGQPVWFLPHTRNPEKAWAGLALKGNVVCIHQPVAGAISESGRALDGMPGGLLRGVKLCIAGDVHVPQKVGPVGITYCGAPYPIRFGDTYQPRVLFLEGGKLTSIPHKTLQKHIVNLGFARGTDGAIATLKAAHPEGIPAGSQLRFRVHLLRNQFSEWHAIQKDIRAYCVKAGWVCCGIELKEVADNGRKLKAKAAAVSPAATFEEFCKARGITGRLYRKGLSLVQQ